MNRIDNFMLANPHSFDKYVEKLCWVVSYEQEEM